MKKGGKKGCAAGMTKDDKGATYVDKGSAMKGGLVGGKKGGLVGTKKRKMIP